MEEVKEVNEKKEEKDEFNPGEADLDFDRGETLEEFLSTNDLGIDASRINPDLFLTPRFQQETPDSFDSPFRDREIKTEEKKKRQTNFYDTTTSREEKEDITPNPVRVSQFERFHTQDIGMPNFNPLNMRAVGMQRIDQGDFDEGEARIYETIGQKGSQKMPWEDQGSEKIKKYDASLNRPQ